MSEINKFAKGSSIDPDDVSKELKKLFDVSPKEDEFENLAIDTEFGKRSVAQTKSDGFTAYPEDIKEIGHGNFLEVLAVDLYSPKLPDAIHCDKFDEEFNPIVEYLKGLGHDVVAKPVRRGKINEILTKTAERKYKKLSGKKLEKALRKDKVLSLELEQYGLDITKIKLSIGTKRGKRKIRFAQDKRKVRLISFFGFADYFKSFGRNWQWLFKDEALLVQFRTVKKQGKMRFSAVIDGVPVDINIELFDTRYVFPPRKASLDGQIKTFGLDKKFGIKLSISEAIFEIYGDVVTELWCKENMVLVKYKYPLVFVPYGKQDAKLTYYLYEELCLMKKKAGEMLNLNSVDELKETCGSNIKDYLYSLIYQNFQNQRLAEKIALEKTKKRAGVGFDVEDETASEIILTEEEVKYIKHVVDTMFEKGTCKSLSKIYGNDFGRIPLTTVGGLLYTRLVEYPHIKGILLDLDLNSCYATVLTNMNLYLGRPVLSTFHYNKPKLKEVIQELRKLNVAKDAWFVRVSGHFKKAVNTILMSDLNFKADKNILDDYARYAYDEKIDEEKDSINLIDAGKIPEPNDSSKILTKMVNHGIINEGTLTVINDLPDCWVQEYMELRVDCVIYYHPDHIYDTIEEVEEAQKKLPKNPVVEKMGDECLKIINHQIHQDNVCLKYSIKKDFKNIKEIRKILKEAKDPLQEILKLIMNSAYGILASLVMKSNDVVASNFITGCARAAAWRMTVFLNGFSPITDGCSFNWLNTCYGYKLKNILKENPDYLTKFDPTIQNQIPLDSVFKEYLEDGKLNKMGFNKLYKEGLIDFLGGNDWLIDLFDYELKDENDRLLFTDYQNTGAGNYIKSGTWGSKFKCRSYQDVNELVDWFSAACSEDYSNHFIFADKEIVKLSQGSIDAIRILQDSDAVANNEKFRLGMPEDTAALIYDSGICHPMGYTKDKFKLMKLISPSQFLYNNFDEYKEVFKLCAMCGSISKYLLTNNWTYDLDEEFLSEFKAYGDKGKIISPIVNDNFIHHYHEMNRKSPVGLGLELLIYGSENLNSIKDVRRKIQEILEDFRDSNKKNFNLKKKIHFVERILPNLDESKYLKHLLAATVILKTNAKIDYIQTLANSAFDPMQRVVFIGDIHQLKNEKKPLWG